MPIREAIRGRILKEMLGGVREELAEEEDEFSSSIVLIMDEVTTKVVSSCCNMMDLGEPGVSLVEAVMKKYVAAVAVV